MSVRNLRTLVPILKTFMKKTFSFLLMSVVSFVTVWANDVYFEADFGRGIPSTFTVIDFDENPTMTGMSNVDFTRGSWSTALVEKGNSAAVSSSYTTYDYPVEDWLILPSINIKSDLAVLAWDGTSLHYDYREDYKVLVSEGGLDASDFIEVYSVTDEDYNTRRHAISLADYVGKNIHIAFVHTGQDGFILAIDNIKVGEWTGEYAFINHTDVSVQGGKEVEIHGFVRNLSSSSFYNPTLVLDGEETPYYSTSEEAETNRVWKTGEDVPFSFTATVPEEGIFRYSLKVDNWTVTDSIFCSAFAHNVLVEKFTGTWCNGCPQGTVNLHRFEQRYRNRIITAEGHCADIMQDYYYSTGLNMFNSNLPSFVYDRMIGYKSQSAQDDGNLAKVMAKAVTAEVVPVVKYLGNDKLEITSTVRFSKEYENSNDRYRVGYAILENVVHVDNDVYMQANSCQQISNREYYYLPSNIPGSRMYYHNVGRGDSTSFDGVPASLPNETLVPGVDYNTTYTMEIPATVLDKKNISIVAIVINTRTHEALNSCRVTTDEIDWSSDVASSKCDDDLYRYTVSGNNVVVSNIDTRATIKVFTTEGSLLGVVAGANTVSVNVGEYRGVAIVAVETATDTKYRKMIIK